MVERVGHLDAESVAVCLLHADRHPGHEAMLGEAMGTRFGDSVHVSLSHQVVGTFREYNGPPRPRSMPHSRRWSAGIYGGCLIPAAGPGWSNLRSCSSSGGLTPLETASSHAALTVLSGPAGGAAAAALISSLRGSRICSASTWVALRAMSA